VAIMKHIGVTHRMTVSALKVSRSAKDFETGRDLMELGETLEAALVDGCPVERAVRV